MIEFLLFSLCPLPHFKTGVLLVEREVAFGLAVFGLREGGVEPRNGQEVRWAPWPGTGGGLRRPGWGELMAQAPTHFAPFPPPLSHLMVRRFILLKPLGLLPRPFPRCHTPPPSLDFYNSSAPAGSKPYAEGPPTLARSKSPQGAALHRSTEAPPLPVPARSSPRTAS